MPKKEKLDDLVLNRFFFLFLICLSIFVFCVFACFCTTYESFESLGFKRTSHRPRSSDEESLGPLANDVQKRLD